jgi:nucleoid-associated protein YgaU
MKSSKWLTLGAVGFALITAPAVASDDASSAESVVETAQPVAEASAAPDPIDSAATPDPVADASGNASAPMADAATPEAAPDAIPSGPNPDVVPMQDPQAAAPVVAEDPALGAEAAAIPTAPDPFLDAVPETAADTSAPSGEVEPVRERVESHTDGVTLGQVGYDSEGRHGRIHLVSVGDTLWDISAAYLATPWVWPSIWTDNRNIENPHLIYPGDRIWITDSEMRILTPEEAERMLAGRPAEMPAAPDTNAEPLIADDLSPHTPVAPARSETRTVNELEAVGLVTAEVFDAAASIVEAQVDKTMLSQGDQVYIGLGAGDVEEGDEFTIFRKVERVFDPETRRLIGYHVEILGWLTVEVVQDEASLASIHHSAGEIERGDRLMPREVIDPEITLTPSPVGVEGRISFFAQSRTMMAGVDYVYLNRGTLDGVEAGSPLEVYRPGRVAHEPARHTQVKVPDRVVAELLVIKAEANSSVAFVSHAATELALGDRFRGVED